MHSGGGRCIKSQNNFGEAFGIRSEAFRSSFSRFDGQAQCNTVVDTGDTAHPALFVIVKLSMPKQVCHFGGLDGSNVR